MGYKIKERREELRMSQQELADKAGVTRQTISLIETGKLENVTLATMNAIATALDSTVSDIFLK